MAEKRKAEDETVRKELSPEIKRMKSSFAKQDLVLIVEGERIYLNKAELMEKSPVFNAMFKSDFKEKDAEEIELPGKNLGQFLMFLRCALSGYNDEITDKNVHSLIPLADEYQMDALMTVLDKSLARMYKENGFQKYRSKEIINGLVEAQKYDLEEAFEVLVDFASRKMYKFFSEAPGFDLLSKELITKIAMHRWKQNVESKHGSSYEEAWDSRYNSAIR